VQRREEGDAGGRDGSDRRGRCRCMTSPATRPRLSVLDLVPVRSGQSTGQAVRATLTLAQVADRLGYTRYWVAEHHNMPAVAATNPPVLIAMVAAATERIRVGSGGVMLPNHAPLVVAEQFALLEAAHPGRIDLGIGRAPGSDPVTSWALRHGAGGVADDAVSRFPDHVADVLTMMAPDGAAVAAGGRRYELRATPAATSTAQVWLLGSSDYSAHLAAELGLPYVFAHHFSGQGTEQALALYRGEFQPGVVEKPQTFLTLNVCVAETAEEAERLVRPHEIAMVALRTGGALAPQLTVEAAEAVELTPEHAQLGAAMRSRWVVGTPDQAAAQVQELAATYDVDEVMVHPVAGATADSDPQRSESRERTLELLAEGLAVG
jgi:luciferase family oxidoreductase group 1